MMRCAQSLCMAVILRPQMRHSSWTSPKRTRASGGLTAGSCGPFLFGCNSAQLPSPPRQHEVGRRGPPMDDALRPVDLDRRPVGLHGGDLAAGDGSTKWRGTPMDDAPQPTSAPRPVHGHWVNLPAAAATTAAAAL